VTFSIWKQCCLCYLSIYNICTTEDPFLLFISDWGGGVSPCVGVWSISSPTQNKRTIKPQESEMLRKVQVRLRPQVPNFKD